MVRDTAHRLAEYLSRRIGDGLRTVVIVVGGGYRLEYIRDGPLERYAEQTLTAVVTDPQVETSLSSPSSDSSPTSGHRTVVYYYEDTSVLQSPLSETEQIIISIRTDFGTGPLRFIEDCRHIVDRKNRAPGRSRTGVRSMPNADDGRRRRRCTMIFSRAPDVGVTELASVTALVENRVISCDGEFLRSSIPTDKRRYRSHIADDSVVFGQTTFESIHNDLPGSAQVVMSRSERSFSVDTTHRAANVEEVVGIAVSPDVETTYVIGGVAIYALFQPHLDRIMLSRVPGEHESDMYYPRWDAAEWELGAETDHEGFTLQE